MLAHAELVRHLIDLDSFVTLCYARLDMSKRSSRSGRLRAHRDRSLARQDRAHAKYCTETICRWESGKVRSTIRSPFRFEPGDLLLFFSDGITEARNPAGELFGHGAAGGMCGANGQLEPAALVEAIRQAVVAFRGRTG